MRTAEKNGRARCRIAAEIIRDPIMPKPSRTSVGRCTLCAAALVLVMLAPPAWAYLDPGTGSMIISAIVGLFATVGLALKTYWYKIKAFFRKDGNEQPAGEDQEIESGRSADH